MRTSFGHIEKACDQLNVRLKKFRDPVNQKTLFGKLDWSLSPTREVYTSILIANRVFHGARLDGHPVRQAHEFINVWSCPRFTGHIKRLRLRTDLT